MYLLDIHELWFQIQYLQIINKITKCILVIYYANMKIKLLIMSTIYLASM